MPSIRVIDHTGGTNRREHLLQHLGFKQLTVWKVEEGGGGLFIVTEEDKVDSFFEEKITESLTREGFELVVTPEIKAMRTVIIRQIDSSYNTMTPEQIQTALNAHNEWLQTSEAKFLPNRGKCKIIKATFSNTWMATRAIYEGIKFVDQTIPPLYVEQEIQVQLPACNNCYSYQHQRGDCNSPRYNRCTRCGGEGHPRSNCNSSRLKCATCNSEEHQTYARECPVKQRLLKERGAVERNKERNKAAIRQKKFSEYQHKRYQPAETNPEINKCQPVPSNAISVILTAITTANIIAKKLPGTFQATMTDIYEYNKLPDVKLPPKIIDQLTYVLQDYQPEDNTNIEQNDNEQNDMETETEIEITQDTVTLAEKKAINWSMPEMSDGTDPDHPPRSAEKRKDLKRRRTKTRSDSEEPKYVPIPGITESVASELNLTDLVPREQGPMATSETKQPSPKQKEEQKSNTKKQEEEQARKTLHQIKEMGISIYYPETWRDKQGNINVERALNTLIQTTMNMTYKRNIGKISPRDLVIESHRKGLNLRKVLSFIPLPEADIHKLNKGHWSVVGIHSESEGE